MSYNIPIAMFVFSRPDTTEQVFEAIRSVRPSKLILIADAARHGKPEEAKRCEKVREIISHVDWECNVTRHFAATNMGCKERLASGLDLIFSEVEYAVILEDDCLPAASFFPFCEELLNRYLDDERVFMISGDKILQDSLVIPHSYYFSAFNHIWGWATWRRAWKHYDKDISDWPMLKKNHALTGVINKESLQYFTCLFDDAFSGHINTWDFQWQLTCLKHRGLTIVPQYNLVKNIGFDEFATHTKFTEDVYNLKHEELTFPLIHPEAVVCNTVADELERDLLHHLPPLFRIKQFIREILKSFGLYERRN